MIGNDKIDYAVLDIETTLDHKSIHGAGVTLIQAGKVVDSAWCDSSSSLTYMLSGVSCVVGHNLIGFDLPVLADVWGWTPDASTEIVDTLIMSRLGNPNRDGGHSLRNLALLCGLNQK
jgi:hypothetical protein